MSSSSEAVVWPRLAPIQIPLQRRLQTLAVVFWFMLIWLPPIIAIVIVVFGSNLTRICFLLYYSCALLLQRFQHTGSLRSNLFRRLSVWKYFAAYFPMSLVKTADLDPTRSYIFGVHPHGIIGVSAFATFGTEALQFSKVFPGITPHLLTLATNFRVPFLRLILGLLGICDASKTTCLTILGRSSGQSIAVVVGGAREALDARPGTCDLTLTRRKGFIKLALETGAALVPVFSFGEVDIYDQVSHKTLRYCQEWVLKMFGFTTPLVKGRGIFNYDFGILPQRRPICVVSGAPIDVTKVPHEKISQQMIDDLHGEYVGKLRDIYDQYKERYAPNQSSAFRVVQ